MTDLSIQWLIVPSLICSYVISLSPGFQDKKLKFSMNGNRQIVGTLRGYDAFLNVVLEEAEHDGTFLGTIVIRGNSIIKFEGLERITAAAAEVPIS